MGVQKCLKPDQISISNTKLENFKKIALWVNHIQSLEIETERTVLFWDFLWCKAFVCMNCELYLCLEYAHMPPWATGFEKSKIRQPNPENFSFKGNDFGAFLLEITEKCWKSSKNASILHPSTYNFLGLGWWILDFSKPVGLGVLWAYSKYK